MSARGFCSFVCSFKANQKTKEEDVSFVSSWWATTNKHKRGEAERYNVMLSSFDRDLIPHFLETIATSSCASRELGDKQVITAQPSLEASWDIKINISVQSSPETSPNEKKVGKKKIHELQISVKCLSLSAWFFLSQLCTYTPGIVFYRCGDISLTLNTTSLGQLSTGLHLYTDFSKEPTYKFSQIVIEILYLLWLQLRLYERK